MSKLTKFKSAAHRHITIVRHGAASVGRQGGKAKRVAVRLASKARIKAAPAVARARQFAKSRNGRLAGKIASNAVPLLLVAILSINRPVQPAPPAPAVKAAVSTISLETPDETPPGDNFQWQGGSTDPKYITIDSVGISGYIQNVGVDQNSQVGTPNNIYMAGWFTESVLPGSPKGLSIIDGHLDGTTAPGIFEKLYGVKPGDEIQVQMGDGSIKKYKAMTTQTVADKDAASYLFSQDPKVKSQLNLITCKGTYDKQAKTYDQRVIVSASLIE